MPHADRPPTPREDHAVLSWLAVEAQLPESVTLQLLAALAAWQPILRAAPVLPGACVRCGR